MSDENLKRQVQIALDEARSARGDIDKKLPEWRKIIHMKPRREPLYEGGPSFTSPAVRGRRDAIIAHIRNALDRDPLFVAVPKSPNAVEAVRPLEAFMDHEITRTHSREEILKAIDEAIDVGTGVVKVEVVSVDRSGNEKEVRAKSIPLEDVYFYPTGVDDVRHASVFERFRLPYYVLRDNADRGFFDPEVVEQVGKSIAEDRGNGNSMLDPTEFDWVPVELWEIWLRYRGQMTRIYYHESAGILNAMPEPYGPDFNRPPYEVIRVMPLQRNIYGESHIMLLEPLQDAMDAAFNATVAEMEHVASPVIFTSDPELWQQLTDNEWGPGNTYLVNRPLTPEVFQVIQHQLNPGTQQFMQLVDRFMEIASFANVQIPGLPTSGDRTATEAQIIASAGTAKLKLMLTNASLGLNRVAQLYWELLRRNRVRGLQAIFADEGFLVVGTVAADIEIPNPEKDLEARQFVYDYLTQQGIPPDVVSQVVAALPPQTERLRIASVNDDRVEWRINGGDTIPEKQLRRQQMMQALQLVSLLPAARQDRRVYELLKETLLALDIPNWKKLLGEPPDAINDDALREAMVMLNQFRAKQPPSRQTSQGVAGALGGG